MQQMQKDVMLLALPRYQVNFTLYSNKRNEWRLFRNVG